MLSPSYNILLIYRLIILSRALFYRLFSPLTLASSFFFLWEELYSIFKNVYL